MTYGIRYEEPLFRPPAEADSLIFQAAYGCPHNTCRFCGMYKTVRYRLRAADEVLEEIRRAGHCDPERTRVFLADGDVMALPFERLQQYLRGLDTAFPRLARVNLYANGSSIMNRSDAQLQALRRMKVNTLYMGLETGSQQILDSFGKTEQVESMIEAVIRAKSFGFKCSVMILIGIGGRRFREEHIQKTAFALNRMQPQLLSALRMIRIPGLAMPGEYEPVTEYEAVAELRSLLERLDLKRTVFRANHSSNPIPLGGRFPQDRETLTAALTRQLESGALDRFGPGRMPVGL